ncbi:hypothetical protein F4777DRAFT_544662 [Nemania sp. FL0916]|nr:hypothetical protein F4777DRAFT_544662 [Nemania sp. FL0916]
MLSSCLTQSPLRWLSMLLLYQSLTFGLPECLMFLNIWQLRCTVQKHTQQRATAYKESNMKRLTQVVTQLKLTVF